MIPKTFCITLKGNPDRTNYAVQHFKQHNLDVEMFEGINGRQFGLDTKIPYLYDTPNWCADNGTPWYLSQGAIGCLLSHYILWKIMLYLPYDEFLVFEDDVFLCDDFEVKLLEYKTQLPDDWQYCFVGFCCLNNDKKIDISKNIIKPNNPPMCTHAYMVKKSALQTLIDTNSVACGPVDIQIATRSLPKLQYYVMVPPLADQFSLQPNKDPIFKSTVSY